MPGVIQRKGEKKRTIGIGKPTTHDVLLRLNKQDHDRLLFLCRLGGTNRNDVLRQCLRYVYELERRGS